MRYCFVIPHFNHAAQFERFLPALVRTELSCIVIDDGSASAEFQILQNAIGAQHNFHLIRHNVNRGKGAAVITGCYYARRLDFTHAIQIDADGQHLPADAFDNLEQKAAGCDRVGHATI